ncbi:hypothetical protein [Streptomyces tendae]|uniref:Uncharacterized protein n=1 Tax=Streptomyces tendae TaxID=1932 RepID=A0ABX6A1C2_STRTE|nr:hypothetical protein [Streptomyces tendae]QER90405.1 hypothetical protein F3L20_32470 [Streptomyces tendae]
MLLAVVGGGSGTAGAAWTRRNRARCFAKEPSLAVLDDLPEHAREMVRDALDIAGRDPWSSARRLYDIDIISLG